MNERVKIDKTLQLEVKRLLDQEINEGVDNSERINHLLTIRKQMKDSDIQKNINSGDLLKAGVSIGSLLLILNYEQFNVISSKAFSFIGKHIL